MKHLVQIFCATLLSIGSLNAQNALVLTSPDVDVEYQVLSVSPNGKWACGNINETTSRGFIWNLETGEIRELSPSGYVSMGLGVSNDGTVVGTFEDDEATANGATLEVAGYWKDGSWHHIKGSWQDNPTDATQGSIAFCISPNGKLLAGGTYVNKNYSPVVWNVETGEQTLYKQYLNEKERGNGVIYSITDDGKACGWVTHPTKNNRTPAIWTSPTDTIMPDYTNVGPFATAGSISTDGTKVLVCDKLYDVNTRTYKTLVSFDDYYSYGLYKVNNDGTVSGSVQDYSQNTQAVIIRKGKINEVSEYLTAKGADLSMFTAYSYVVSFDDNETAFAMMAADTTDSYRSVVVRTGIGNEKALPNSLSAKALTGAGAVELTWKAPLSATGDAQSYVLYRNGNQVYSGTELNYTDAGLADGTYSYTVKAVYADGESAQTEATSATLTSEAALQSPRDLQMVQRGYNNAQLTWEEPVPAQSAYDYMYDNAGVYSLGGGAYSFEAGIRLKSATLAAYAANDKALTGVSFYPMSVIKGWKINIYDVADLDNAVYSQSVDPSTLVIGQSNVVNLTTPYVLPEGKDIIVAVEADVDETKYNYSVIGFTYGIAEPGYTDLMHRVNVSDDEKESFYSMQEYAVNSEEGAYMFQVTWPITALFGAKDGSRNEVKDYNVYVDNKLQSTTTSLDSRLSALSEGTHRFAVSANYTNGKEGPQTYILSKIANDNSALKPINVNVTVNDHTMNATWDDMTQDKNRSILCFSSDNSTGGVTGSASAGYGYMVETIYTGKDIRAYDGYNITAFRFYPLATADFTFYLKKDGEQVAELYAENYTLNQWNELTLDEPITLDRNSEYELILDCYDVESGLAPLAMDDQLARQGVSDLYSDDNGESFTSLVNAGGKNANWMMGMVLNTPEATTSPVKGYNVLIDGKQDNAELLTTPAYERTYDNNGTHNIRVRSITDNGYATSTVQYFTIGLSAINNVTADNAISVAHDVTSLVVNGGSVKSLTLYTADGRQAGKAQSNTIGIRSLQAGTYVLSIELTDGTKLSQKVALQ